MPLWYPVCDHPDAGGPPWFAVDPEGLVYRTDGHPAGPSTTPSFRILDAIAYSTGHDTIAGWTPWFTISGSMVAPADGHPLGPSSVPWYQSRG